MMLIQSSILITVLLAVDLLLRRRVRAIIRYSIWMLVFVKLILPGTLCLPTGIGYWLGDYLPGDSSVSEQPDSFGSESGKMSVTASAVSDDSYAVPSYESGYELAGFGSEDSASTGMSRQTVIFLVWLVGVFVLSVLLVQRIWFVHGLVDQSDPVRGGLADKLNECRGRVGIGRSVELRISQAALSPATCGLLRPKILLPASMLARLSADKLRTVLIHELAHIKRGDLWVNLAQNVLQAVYFYNPLLWLANAVVRRVREQAVDEMVLACLGDQAKSYSKTLVDIAEMAFARPSLGLRPIGVVESRKALAGRIRHITTRPFPKTARLGVRGVMAVLIIAAVLLPMAKAQNTNTAEPTHPENRSDSAPERQPDDAIAQHPPDMAVYRQLAQVVDLSGLSPEMSFAEALVILRYSVEPALDAVVLWDDLKENAGIEQSTPIKMKGSSAIRLGTALDDLLKSVSTGAADLGYQVDNGIITIVTLKLVTRVYDISRLVDSPDDQVEDKAERVQQLMNLIVDTIEPDSWYRTGTGEGTMTSYQDKKLIILQIPAIHNKIERLLSEMRKAIPPQITVEGRFLSVSDEFLESMGVDGNSLCNIRVARHRFNSSAETHTEPFEVEFEEEDANAPVGESGNPAISKSSACLLDDLQVHFLLGAVQAHKDSKVLTAPKLIVWEGERAELRIETENPYVSGYVEPNSSSERPEAKVEFIERGATLEALARLTDDGANIKLKIDFEISDVIGFEERLYKGQYVYQVPTMEVVSSSTTVLMPDGATVLIGGKQITAENDDGIIEERNLLVLIKAKKSQARADENDTLAESAETISP
jgi:beta-lactamase regulating signal transducer with metallopeptidase domain